MYIMDSYSGFADRFDLLIDWERRRKREMWFFKRVLQDRVKSVLDCHCGTGFHCVMLTDMGYEVEGVDRSPDMLRVAKQNLERRGMEVRLHCRDIKDMLPALDRKYDCVLSMGNSLPHEQSDDDLIRALESMWECLSDNGTCIVHMENFDALYRDRERFIPTGHSRRSDGSETFIFAIDYFRDRVVFNIISVIERCGRSQFNVDVVEYNPVPVKKMERLIVKAGFCEVRKYCDFRMTPFGMRDTYDVIYVAEKGMRKQTIIS